MTGGVKGKQKIYYVVIKLEDGRKFTARQNAIRPSGAIIKTVEKLVSDGVKDVVSVEVKPETLPANQYERRRLIADKRAKRQKVDINISI